VGGQAVTELVPAARGTDIREERAEFREEWRRCGGLTFDRCGDGSIGESLVALGHAAKAKLDFLGGETPVEYRVVVPLVPGGERFGVDAVREGMHVEVLAILVGDEQRLVSGETEVGERTIDDLFHQLA
jgi:hypothetical protein